MFKEHFKEWSKVIDEKRLVEVLSVLKQEYARTTICPKKNDIFKAFSLCPYDSLKVVMIGQDPYPQLRAKDTPVATGILFGNAADTKWNEISPPLRVVVNGLLNKEFIENTEVINLSRIFDITLESWAKQGILMINSALTVEANKIGSHTNLWRPLMASFLNNLCEWNTGLIFVLFGGQAQSFREYINPKTNTILECFHPAYAARQGIPYDCEVFNRVNEILKKTNNTQIKWYNEVL